MREAHCWGFIKTWISSPKAETWKSTPKLSVLCPLVTLLPMLFACNRLGPSLKPGLNWICFGITWEKNVNQWISNFCCLKVLGWCWAWGKWGQGGLRGFIPSYAGSKIWLSYQYGKEIPDQPRNVKQVQCHWSHKYFTISYQSWIWLDGFRFLRGMLQTLESLKLLLKKS